MLLLGKVYICCFRVDYIATRILRRLNILNSTLKRQLVVYVEKMVFLRQLRCNLVFQGDKIVYMNCEPASLMIMIECKHSCNDLGKRLNVRNVLLFTLRAYKNWELQVQNSVPVISKLMMLWRYILNLTIHHIFHLFIIRSVELILCIWLLKKNTVYNAAAVIRCAHWLVKCVHSSKYRLRVLLLSHWPKSSQ